MWECFAKTTVLDPKKVNIKPEIINYVFIGYAYNNNTTHINFLYTSQILRAFILVI